MSNGSKTALALAAASVALVVMAWFDTTVVRAWAQRGVQTFDRGQYVVVAALGMILIAGAVLLLAMLAWRSRSVAVGVAYALVGAYFALQSWIWMNLAGPRNGGQPLLPYPLDRVVNHLFNATVGPLNAVGIVGAGMLIAGVAVITAWLRERSGAGAPR